MRFVFLLLVILLTAAVFGCAVKQTKKTGKKMSFSPPIAPVHPTELKAHGITRVDDYYWLNQRENPETTAYLKAENEYTDSVM